MKFQSADYRYLTCDRAIHVKSVDIVSRDVVRFS